MTLFTRFSKVLLGSLLLASTASAQTSTTTTTLSGLPNGMVNGTPTARVDALTVTLAPGTDLVVGAGQTTGWGFKISWDSNAGDYISFTNSRLTGDFSALSDAYRDAIAKQGGNVATSMAAGSSWQQDFADGATGIGGLTLRSNAGSGAQYSGQLRLDFDVYEGAPQYYNRLGNFSIFIDVTVTAAPRPLAPPADQSITFPSIGNKTFGAAPFTISATAAGSLPVTLTSETTGVCTVSTATVTLTSAGTCIITASQDGDETHNAAPPVSQSFDVTKAAATVTLNGALSPLFDGSPKSLAASTTPGGLTVLVTYNGDSSAPTTAGTYQVNAIIDDPAYDGSASAMLTITRSTTVVTWNAPAAIAYGAALGATQLNATANTPGTFSYQPAAGTRLNAGAQTLTVAFTPTNAAQFDAATMTVPLTVNKATLTVSGPTLTREFGAANPVLSPIYAGFAPGDAASSLTGSPSLTVAATPASQPGSYPISVTTGTLASPNYTFSANNGSLTVVDTTAPVLTLPAALTATAYREAGIAVTYVTTAIDAVDGSRPVTCAPASGSVFAPGATTVTCTALDSRGNRGSGAFTVAVTLANNRIGRFVAFSRELTMLRANTAVVTGDVGANERRRHAHRREDDDDEEDERSRTDVTVRIGERVTMQQATSRVVGDTVRLLNRASVYNVIDNVMFNRRATVLGQVTTPMTPLPYLTLPVMPAITAGTTTVTVRKNQTLTLPAGAYGNVSLESGATLVMTGGLYQIRSLDVDQNATVMFRAATELRIKTELDTANKAKLVLDPGVNGLRSSQIVIYVEGADESSRGRDRDDDGDDNGASVVSLGSQNVVQANIYAPNGTIWMRSKMQGSGAFIGDHVRVGQQSTLTLDSAFR